MTIEQMAQNLSNAVKEIEGLPRVGSITFTDSIPTVHMMDKALFANIEAEVVVEKRNCFDYPYQAEKTVNGVKFITLLGRSVVEHKTCPLCGTCEKDEVSYEAVAAYLNSQVEVQHVG